MPDVYEMESPLSPGEVTRVDAYKFAAMKDAYLAVLPYGAPGMTDAEIRALIEPILSQEHFPDGLKAGWWEKRRSTRPGSQGYSWPNERKNPAVLSHLIGHQATFDRR